MAIRDLGGRNIYVIDVAVPKITDSRGVGYGLAYSDQRWKMFEIIYNEKLALAKEAGGDEERKLYYNEMNRLNKELLDLNRQKVNIAAGAAKADATARAKAEAAASVATTGGSETTVYEEYNKQVFNPYKMTYETVKQDERRVTKTKTPGTRKTQSTETGTTAKEGEKTSIAETVAPSLKQIDDLINQRAAELEAMKAAGAPGRGGPSMSPLDSARLAYAEQMGAGGFGVAKGTYIPEDTGKYGRSAVALDKLLSESGGKIDIQNLLQDIRSRNLNVPMAEAPKMSGEVSRVMETPSPASLPSQSSSIVGNENKPQLSARVPAEAPDAGAFGLSPAGELFYQKHRNYRQAPIVVPPASVPSPPGPATPLEANIQRAIEMEALGMTPDFTASRAAAIEAEQTAPATYPVETMGGLPTTTFGRPGGVLDNIRLFRGRNQLPPQGPGIPGTEQTVQLKPVAPTPSFEMETPTIRKLTPSELKLQQLQEKLKEAEPIIQSLPDQITVPPMKTEGDQGSLTPAKRADMYAMKVTVAGAKLASQPKKFERLAKTDLPPAEREKKTAPYVALVDKLYDTNKGRATAFKDTYDEVSKFYAKEPDIRKSAHEYLVAKDMLEKSVTQPA